MNGIVTFRHEVPGAMVMNVLPLDLRLKQPFHAANRAAPKSLVVTSASPLSRKIWAQWFPQKSLDSLSYIGLENK